MSNPSHFPTYLTPHTCRKGHAVVTNGYTPRSCPVCARAKPAPAQDTAGWRETMASVARSEK